MTDGAPEPDARDLFDAIAGSGDRLAIVDDEAAWTFDALERRARSLAAALLAGRPGLRHERVALLAAPGCRYAAGLMGIWHAGGVAVPLSPVQPEAEWAYTLADSGVTEAVVDGALAPRLGTAAAGGLRMIGTEATGSPDAVRQTPPAGPALILYTSGTTSRPKGVVLTHANLAFQTRCLCEAWAWRPSDRILHVLPLNHVHGIVNALLCALRAGATCEMLPRFDAARVWGRLAGGDVTLFMAVPTIYRRLVACWDAAPPRSRGLWSQGARSLRLMVSGSAALPVGVLERWEALTGHRLLERYGMTEIGMALSNPLVGERRPGAVGRPLPGVEVRLLDESGCDVPAGQPGEIHVRSRGVFLEYWNRPVETAAAFRPDRWFRTGDVARLDDGAYRILGRLSVDIIKTGGEKVSALEVEETLREHPAVADCAVVGVADPEWGERVAAAVVTKAGTPIGLDEIRDWARSRLARHKLPGRLVLVDELPRNALGKVFKPAVRELFLPS